MEINLLLTFLALKDSKVHGNSRSLTFGVLMFGPGLKNKTSHECEGKFFFHAVDRCGS